jgi:hypothetical protein
MAKSTTDIKRRPGQSGTPVLVRLQPELLAVVDSVLAGESEPKLLSRPDVVRSIIRDWAIGNGYLPPPPEDD